MKRKILVMLIGCVLILGVLNVTFAATKKTENMTEEKVQTMIDETVTTAVNGKVSELEQASKLEDDANAEASKEENSKGIGYLAAAIATGLACIGSGIAVAVVASSAVGAVSENPALLGKTIIFAGLAEGIAIYGLIIAIMILNKI